MVFFCICMHKGRFNFEENMNYVHILRILQQCIYLLSYITSTILFHQNKLSFFRSTNKWKITGHRGRLLEHFSSNLFSSCPNLTDYIFWCLTTDIFQARPSLFSFCSTCRKAEKAWMLFPLVLVGDSNNSSPCPHGNPHSRPIL